MNTVLKLKFRAGSVGGQVLVVQQFVWRLLLIQQLGVPVHLAVGSNEYGSSFEHWMRSCLATRELVKKVGGSSY